MRPCIRQGRAGNSEKSPLRSQAWCRDFAIVLPLTLGWTLTKENGTQRGGGHWKLHFLVEQDKVCWPPHTCMHHSSIEQIQQMGKPGQCKSSCRMDGLGLAPLKWHASLGTRRKQQAMQHTEFQLCKTKPVRTV